MSSRNNSSVIIVSNQGVKQETLSNGTLLCHGSRMSGHSIEMNSG